MNTRGMPASPRKRLGLCALAGALLLGACAEFSAPGRKQAAAAAHPRTPAARPAAPAEREPGPARERAHHARVADNQQESGLREGIQLYNEGDFDGAIRRLSARDVGTGPMPTRLAALKYLAFSYCVTARPAPCRQAFDRALRLDPAFDLARGEHGHPLWGPVFDSARQAALQR